MVDQIIDRRTIAIPGPQGDVTPDAIEARDRAEAAQTAAEAARDDAASSETAAASSASSAAASESEAEAWAQQAEAWATNTVQVTDWNDAVQPGAFWSTGTAANAPVSTSNMAGIVTLGFSGSTPTIFQEVRGAGTAHVEVWKRFRYANGTWTEWELREDTGWVDLSQYLNGPTFSGQMEGRITDGIEAEIRGAVNGPFGTGNTGFGNLPAEWRPPGLNARGSANLSGGWPGVINLGSNGNISVGTGYAFNSGNTCSFSIPYKLG